MQQSIISFKLTSVLIFSINLSANTPQTPTSTLGDPVTITGQVRRQPNGNLIIKLSDDQSFTLQSAKRRTQEDLSHLENGDYMIGLGRIMPVKKVILLDMLEMVGIKKVLGSWAESRKRKLFDFHDFTNLSVKNADSTGVSLAYRLVPDKKDQWTIFLSGNYAVRMGTLKYLPRSLNIELIDLESGTVGERYYLSKKQ